MRSQSNAITCAWAVPNAIIKENISVNDKRGHIAWFMLTQHETLSQNKTKAFGGGLQRIQPCYLAQVQEHASYLNTVRHFKLLDRKRRKGCLCKLSTQFQSQTHLHLPDCQSAFNFSRLRVPVPDHSLKTNVISPQMPCAKGSLMIQASVWEAIWASPTHNLAGGAEAGLYTRWGYMCEFWQWIVGDLEISSLEYGIIELNFFRSMWKKRNDIKYILS